MIEKLSTFLNWFVWPGTHFGYAFGSTTNTDDRFIEIRSLNVTAHGYFEAKDWVGVDATYNRACKVVSAINTQLAAQSKVK